MNLPLLKTELEKAQYVGLSSEAAAVQLNAPTVPFYVEVPTPDLTNFLMNSGLYAKLLAVYRDHADRQVRVAAEGAIDLAQSQISHVNVQNPAIQKTLPALVSGGVWTQAEANSVLEFAKRVSTRALELLGEEVTPQHVQAARWLDQTALFVARRTALDAIIADLETGNAYHELSEVQ